MIVFVRAHRGRREAPVLQLGELHERGCAFGDADRGRHLEMHAEPMAVFHDRMAGKAEPGFLARSFAQQLRLGIGRALVGLVAALFAVKVLPRIARARTLRRLILGPEAFQARPGFDEGAVCAEVLVADPASRPRQRTPGFLVGHRGPVRHDCGGAVAW